MDVKVYEGIKIRVQEIIDLIAEKNNKEANTKLTLLSENLDELLDHTKDDEELREISRYQVLLTQLRQKIDAE